MRFSGSGENSSSTFYLTKFELIITYSEHNSAYLPNFRK